MNYIRRYDGDKMIGELEWDQRPGATYECHLDVEPSHHRRGIGRQMMTELEDIVRSRKGMCLYSFCAGDNERARLFFLACGFRAVFAPSFYGAGRHAYFLWKPVGVPDV